METPEKSSPEQNEAGYEEKPTTSTKNKKSKNPRRFTDEQIQSLESIFKLETKPESSKKLQLARDLGLQPRQIAIWFQNRRARWKSRQIEEEYRVLRAKYDSLHLQFDDLKREKQSLQMQLQDLSDEVKNLDKVNLADVNAGLKECPNSSNERMEHNDVMHTDDEEIITSCFKKLEEEGPLRWGEGGEISHLGSPKRWCNLPPRGLLDQWSGTSNSNWWES